MQGAAARGAGAHHPRDEDSGDTEGHEGSTACVGRAGGTPGPDRSPRSTARATRSARGTEASRRPGHDKPASMSV